MIAPWHLLLAGILAIAGVTWLVHEIREDGARSLANAIERQNNDAENSAHEKRLEYDSCLDAGGLWDFSTGQCSRSARGGRH